MKRLSTEQVKNLHAMLIARTGGLGGVRDIGLLESALHAPFQTMYGQPLVGSIEEQAAYLGYALIKNHAFIDGNKRIGMLVMLTFLELNGVVLTAQDNDIIAAGFGVASDDMDRQELLAWIKKHRENG
ncbi:MAG: type II toxin-antitoxin system death-on-curing family toxin [Christensenellales bacterium]|jgi:death-on-curing protein